MLDRVLNFAPPFDDISPRKWAARCWSVLFVKHTSTLVIYFIRTEVSWEKKRERERRGKEGEGNTMHILSWQLDTVPDVVKWKLNSSDASIDRYKIKIIHLNSEINFFLNACPWIFLSFLVIFFNLHLTITFTTLQRKFNIPKLHNKSC